MPSKTSKAPNTPSPWKHASACSEAQLVSLAEALARELKAGDRVALEGPMGAGKTTFCRALLHGLGVVQPPEGSPSFAIAHEYQSPKGDVIHMDFYRLRDESEIDDAGIPAYYWERNAIVISEWLSNFPNFQAQVFKLDQVWKVSIDFAEGIADCRRVDIVGPSKR